MRQRFLLHVQAIYREQRNNTKERIPFGAILLIYLVVLHSIGGAIFNSIEIIRLWLHTTQILSTSVIIRFPQYADYCMWHLPAAL